MSVDTRNAREEGQLKVLDQIIRDDLCPFCLENLKHYHKPPIKVWPNWIVTKNQWPYKNTREHLLLILRRHETAVEGLRQNEWAELLAILQSKIEEENLPGGALGMRFGDTLFSGGTVNHLHAQIIVPDINAPDYEPARFYIGGRKE